MLNLLLNAISLPIMGLALFALSSTNGSNIIEEAKEQAVLRSIGFTKK